ncbi:sugar transferase [uncultured Granulicatella sp.]|uniref:sugar transferase n=1 Tax=uncultured Granulicatella sp. TaxID=316089 RepID=UPI0028D87037|nr:sugar transferase [uncultured Granulicatella sp.]
MNIYRGFKRLTDFFLSIVLLIPAIPICLISAIFIILETNGNPLYVQERVGLNGDKFKIYKLRSMYSDAEKDGHKWAEKEDSRITKVGSIIRKTRIDELPQLINIIKGEMAIIGPRPERPEFIEEFLKEIPDFNDRLAVKPGITGWAQVNGGYELSPKEKLKYDQYYIEHENFKLDILILFKTIKVVFTGEGSR